MSRVSDDLPVRNTSMTTCFNVRRPRNATVTAEAIFSTFRRFGKQFLKQQSSVDGLVEPTTGNRIGKWQLFSFEFDPSCADGLRSITPAHLPARPGEMHVQLAAPSTIKKKPCSSLPLALTSHGRSLRRRRRKTLLRHASCTART